MSLARYLERWPWKGLAYLSAKLYETGINSNGLTRNNIALSMPSWSWLILLFFILRALLASTAIQGNISYYVTSKYPYPYTHIANHFSKFHKPTLAKAKKQTKKKTEPFPLYFWKADVDLGPVSNNPAALRNIMPIFAQGLWAILHGSYLSTHCLHTQEAAVLHHQLG